jgi:two-component system, OmpR family, sensor histidine kinase KdpD
LSIFQALFRVLILGPLTGIPNAATAIRLGLAGHSTELVGETFNSNAVSLGIGAVVPALFVSVSHPSGTAKLQVAWVVVMTVVSLAMLSGLARSAPARGRGARHVVSRFCGDLGSRLISVYDSSRARAFGRERPPLWLGVAFAALAVAVATAAIYPLKALAPAVSLSVVYLPVVLLVSAYWGLVLGLATSLASAAAFNFFHIPPVGRFTIADSRNWVALAAFTVVAATVSTVAELARNRAAEAQERRREADLAAGLARELLAGARTEEVLGSTARRLAEAMALPSAAIELGVAPNESRRLAMALRGPDGDQVATLLVPRNLPSDTVDRLQAHVVGPLGALVAIALHRDAVQAEAVETAALRRSDDVKTALLRAVSHDLRTPLTSILAAGHALGTDSLTGEDRAELSAAVVDGADRLATLVDKLLDLSKLQAGRAVPRRDWVSLEEVVLAAREGLGDRTSEIRLTVAGEIPDVRADAAQLERAFANLLENARRYSAGQPVAVQIRRSGARVLVRVVDRGPGIQPSERERIFEPFYRGPEAGGEPWTGSGLGLAIAKGFIEANGGTIAVESLPGQGTSFVVSLPVLDTVAVQVGA